MPKGKRSFLLIADRRPSVELARALRRLNATKLGRSSWRAELYGSAELVRDALRCSASEADEFTVYEIGTRPPLVG